MRRQEQKEALFALKGQHQLGNEHVDQKAGHIDNGGDRRTGGQRWVTSSPFDKEGEGGLMKCNL